MVPFSIPRQALGLRPKVIKGSHHETWLHLHFGDWSNKWNHQTHHNGNICLEERPAGSGNRAQKNVASAKFFERPFALVTIAQPLALLGSCVFPCFPSRSDLMRFDVSSISLSKKIRSHRKCCDEEKGIRKRSLSEIVGSKQQCVKRYWGLLQGRSGRLPQRKAVFKQRQ